MLDVVRRTAEGIYMPLTVGGGVRSRRRRPHAAARRRRQGLAQHRGARAARADPRGRASASAASASWSRSTPRREPTATGVELGGLHPRRPPPDRARRGRVGARGRRRSGAGEILLTSMDRDGTKRRLRPRADARGGRGGVGARSSPRAAPARSSTSARALVEGARRRRAGRLALPLRPAHDRRGQAAICAERGVAGAARAVSPTDDLRCDAHGLIPAVVQETETGEVLMVAWMDRDAARGDAGAPGLTHFWSRSRAGALAQGRDVGPHPARGRPLRRLRRGHAAGAGAPGRRGLPHRSADAASSRRLDGGVAAPRPARRARRCSRSLERVLESRKAAPPPGSYVAALLAKGRGRRSAGRSARRPSRS